MRYVLMKRLRDGRRAWYWNPPRWARQMGMAAESLGTNARQARLRALALYATLVELRSPAQVTTTVSWGIQRYLASPAFAAKAPSTQRTYRQSARLLETWVGRFEVEMIEPRHAASLYEKIRATSHAQANGMVRFARLLWRFLQDQALLPLSDNPFRKVRIEALQPRDHLWTRHQVADFTAVADAQGEHGLALAVMLGIDLCQRQGDILGLRWDDIRDGVVHLRQNKTGAVVVLPLAPLPELRARLQAAAQTCAHLVTQPSGAPWAADVHRFRRRFRQIADRSGLPSELTFMDLRRSGLTELGDAGATDEQIRAVSGHRTREVVKVYVKSTPRQAEDAFSKRQRRLPGGNDGVR